MPVAISGEVFPNGHRTAEGVVEALVGYGVPEGDIIELPDANSTATQAREFARWSEEAGKTGATSVVQANHARRVSRTPSLRSGIVSVRRVLDSGLEIPASDIEVVSAYDNARAFDQQNAAYENDPLLRGFTELTRLDGLTVMAAAFNRVGRDNPNVLDMVGRGVVHQPQLIQGRYKEFFS